MNSLENDWKVQEVHENSILESAGENDRVVAVRNPWAFGHTGISTRSQYLKPTENDWKIKEIHESSIFECVLESAGPLRRAIRVHLVTQVWNMHSMFETF